MKLLLIIGAEDGVGVVKVPNWRFKDELRNIHPRMEKSISVVKKKVEAVLRLKARTVETCCRQGDAC